MAHEFGCSMLCWLKPVLNLLLFLGFLFQDWMMNFRACIFAACFSFLHKKRLRKFHQFSNAFRNKEREQNNYISCVFKHTFACNSLRDTVRSEFWKTYALLRA